MRILYVEDNEVNQALVARVTRIQNHELVFCSEGEQALEMLAEDPDINLVLMDIELAGVMTGLDVVTAMRARNDKRPVVAVTAYAMMGDREKMLDAGCDQYLPKPLQIPDLLTVFSEYAARLEAGETLSAHTAEPTASEPAAAATVSQVKEPAAPASAPAAEPAPTTSAPALTSAPVTSSAPESPSDGTPKEAAEAATSAETPAPAASGTAVQASTAAETPSAKEDAPAATPSTSPGNGTSAPSVTPAQALNQSSLATSPSKPAED